MCSFRDCWETHRVLKLRNFQIESFQDAISYPTKKTECCVRYPGAQIFITALDYMSFAVFSREQNSKGAGVMSLLVMSFW